MKEAKNYIIQAQNSDMMFLENHGGQTPTSSPISQIQKSNKPSPITSRWQKCWKMSYAGVLQVVEYIFLHVSIDTDKIMIRCHERRLDLFAETYGLPYEEYDENMDKWPLKRVKKDGV